MAKYLRQRELSVEVAEMNGWYPCFWRGVPSIVIPATTTAGVEWFQVRAMENAAFRYDSPKGSRGDALIFVFPSPSENWIAPPRTAVVFEGPMDALAAAEFGFLGIATMGITPSQAQIDHLLGWLRTREIRSLLIVPDRDGPEFVRTVIEAAPSQIWTRIVFPTEKDLASMSRPDRKKLLSDGN